MEENIEQRVDLTLFSEKIQELKDQIASVIVGQEQTVDLVLAAIPVSYTHLDVYKRQEDHHYHSSVSVKFGTYYRAGHFDQRTSRQYGTLLQGDG